MNDNGSANRRDRENRALAVTDDRRKRYSAPKLSVLGDLRRLTAAGNPASQADLGGTWPNMQKLTMLG